MGVTMKPCEACKQTGFINVGVCEGDKFCRICGGSLVEVYGEFRMACPKPECMAVHVQPEAISNASDVDWKWLVGKDFYIGTVEEVNGDTANMVQGDDHYRIRISELFEAEAKRTVSKMQNVAPLDEVAKNMIIEVGGNQSILNIVWMQHRLEQLLSAGTAETDLAKAREVIAELVIHLAPFCDPDVSFEEPISDAEEHAFNSLKSARAFMEGK